MKKNLILTIIVVVLNGWALINLFHFLGNEHKRNLGTDIGSGEKIAMGSSQNIDFSQGSKPQKKQLSWAKTEIPVSNGKRPSSNRNTNNGSQFSLQSFDIPNITDIASSRAVHLSNAEKDESGNESSSYLLNILETNKQVNQLRITSIGSQYAYNMSKTSFSESAPANENSGGVMQKADDNPGGYNDTPVGSYWVVLCVLIFSYLLLITFRETHFLTIEQSKQRD